MTEAITYGTPVRFTVGPLGLVANTKRAKVEPEDVEKGQQQGSETVTVGDEGTYIGPHPTVANWSLIAVGDLICPCHSSHFEVIA